MASAKIKVSICVLFWNHWTDVGKPFLDQFFEHTSGVEYELIAVNNGSKDGTKEGLQTYASRYPHMKIIECTGNAGFSRGNNIAVEKAKGEYVLFLNNDVVIHNDHWLADLLKVSGSKRISGAQLVTDNSLTEFRNKNQPYINGWCLCMKRDEFLAVGKWNELFNLGYFEDNELCYRSILDGYTLVKVDLNLEHLGSRSSIDQLDMNEQTKINQIIYRNLLYSYEKKDKLRIVFMATGMYPFMDSWYEGQGVGGAEASLILLTRELAKRGHIVEVFNDTTIEDCQHGVYYRNLSHFNHNEYADVFVLFRNSMFGLGQVHAGTKIFWSCDQHTTNDWETDVIPHIDQVLAISEYHKAFLIKHFPINPSMITVLDLGVQGSDYVEKLPKVSGQMLYCSVPRRGLEHLKVLLPKIQARFPGATLHITSDYRLWGSGEENQEYKAMFQDMPGVVFHGKVDRVDLVRLQKESQVMAYPCIYDENFCISALECLAAGAIPVTSDIGALKTTVGEHGVVIPGDPSSITYQEKFVDAVVSIFEGKRVPDIFSLERTWGVLVLKYEAFFYAMLKTTMNVSFPSVCPLCKAKVDNAYVFFLHKVREHVPSKDKQPKGTYREAPTIFAKIHTARSIELSVNNTNITGKEFLIPQEQAGDIIRILTEAYGEGIILHTDMHQVL